MNEIVCFEDFLCRFVEIRKLPGKEVFFPEEALSLDALREYLGSGPEENGIGISDGGIIMEIESQLAFLDVVASEAVVGAKEADVIPRCQGHRPVEIINDTKVCLVSDNADPVLVPLSNVDRIVN